MQMGVATEPRSKMSLHQLTQTMVARELSLNKEVTLMFHVMFLHQLRQTKVPGTSLSTWRST